MNGVNGRNKYIGIFNTIEISFPYWHFVFLEDWERLKIVEAREVNIHSSESVFIKAHIQPQYK